MRFKAYQYGRDPLYGCLNYEIFELIVFLLLYVNKGEPITSLLHLKVMVFLMLKAEGVEGITPFDF